MVVRNTKLNVSLMLVQHQLSRNFFQFTFSIKDNNSLFSCIIYFYIKKLDKYVLIQATVY